MSARPRNEGPGRVSVGSMQSGGQVTVTDHGELLVVNVAHLTGMSVRISREQAVELHRLLGELLGLD